MNFFKISTASLVLFFILTLSKTVYSQETATAPIGKWEGKLQLPGTELRIFFQVTSGSDGKLKARMASPDQGANNIPVENVIWKNDSLYLYVKVAGGVYAAKLSADKKQFEGLWSQGGSALPLTVKKTETLEFYAKRPQDPKKPYPYLVEDVQYDNESAKISLGGTLTVPKGKGSFPVVVLISGSGAQNRDEEIMGHRPFLVIADYLTKSGIAVLRVDDRGVDKSTGNAATATSFDNSLDVLASINYLKKRTEIDKSKIGLIGHSEGGMIAPMIASQSKDVAFIVLLAGVGLPGDILHRKQVEDVLRLSKTNEPDIQKALALNDQLYAVIKAEKSTVAIDGKLAEVLKSNVPVSGIDMSQVVKNLAQPWFRYFINFKPAPYLQKVKCPVLALNGNKDVQVASAENLAAIEKHLKAGGNKKVTIKELQGLNHLFQTAETGSMNEYAKIEETISPVALKIIGDWISGVVK